MAAGDQIWRQVKQGPHREHFPALWRALPFVLPPIPSQRSRSFPGLTMRSQVLQSAIFSCIMQTAYRFVGVELRFRHPASRKHGGCHVRGIASFLREGQTRQKPRSRLAPGLLPGILMIAINRLSRCVRHGRSSKAANSGIAPLHLALAICSAGCIMDEVEPAWMPKRTDLCHFGRDVHPIKSSKRGL